jgi:hypothetical protein
MKERRTTMPTPNRISRKISSEELKKGFIFVLKDQVSFFPPMGKPFIMCKGAEEKKVYLESYRCTCRGPQLEHEHYFIRWDGLRFGEKITITKDEKVAERYLLSSNR